jgi:hypothetical protein
MKNKDKVARAMALQNSTQLTNIVGKVGVEGVSDTLLSQNIRMTSKYIKLNGAVVSDSLFSIGVYKVNVGDQYQLKGKLFSNAGIMTVCSFFSDITLMNFVGNSNIAISGTIEINNQVTVPTGASYMAINSINWYSDIAVYPITKTKIDMLIQNVSDIQALTTSVDKVLTYMQYQNTIGSKVISTNGTLTSLSNYNVTIYPVITGNLYNIKGITQGNLNSYAIYSFYSDSGCTNLISVGSLCQGWGGIG